MFRSSISAAAALAVAIAPVAAQAASQPAPRSEAVVEGGDELVGTTAWILAAIGLGLIIWGIIELTNDDEEPDSP